MRIAHDPGVYLPAVKTLCADFLVSDLQQRSEFSFDAGINPFTGSRADEV
jgi:hypothetical protein